MDASQITKLLQKQNTKYIHRSQTVDSSTLTWQNQIQSSTYIKGNIPTQTAEGCASGNGSCAYGGQGKEAAIATGSTQRYPSVYAGASGSASQVYSSDSIMLQRAGQKSCAVPGAMVQSYVIQPECYGTNTNGPLSDQSPPINNRSNPYLPPFDTFYQFKTSCVPTQDQNQKHFVVQCHKNTERPAA